MSSCYLSRRVQGLPYHRRVLMHLPSHRSHMSLTTVKQILPMWRLHLPRTDIRRPFVQYIIITHLSSAKGSNILSRYIFFICIITSHFPLAFQTSPSPHHLPSYLVHCNCVCTVCIDRVFHNFTPCSYLPTVSVVFLHLSSFYAFSSPSHVAWLQ